MYSVPTGAFQRGLFGYLYVLLSLLCFNKTFNYKTIMSPFRETAENENSRDRGNKMEIHLKFRKEKNIRKFIEFTLEMII